MENTFTKENRQQLEKLAKIFNTDKVVTTEDAHEVLKGVAKIMLSFKNSNIVLNKETEKKVKDLFDKISDMSSKMKTDMDSSHSTMKKDMKADMASAMKECKKIMDRMIEMKPKDGEPGKPGENGSPDTPDEVRDKLESLKKGKKLSVNAIEELAGIIEDLYSKLEKQGKELSEKSSSTGRASGRVYRFIDDETPTGTINGSNQTFTLVKTPISGSLKVYLGGIRLRVSQDYTFSHRTLTMTIAPQVGEVFLVDYRY